MQLKDIFITPPFAIARVGRSSNQCVAYSWSENDITPRGTGKTTVKPEETLEISDSGQVSSHMPEDIKFKDDQGFRPVSPFFEVWGVFEEQSGEVLEEPLTLTRLIELGIDPNSVTWFVHHANHKIYHYTLNEKEKIEAQLAIAGGDYSKNEIKGKSELFTDGTYLPMGYFQVAKPDTNFPKIRARFYAPLGDVYGPTDIERRVQVSELSISLPTDRRIVRPDSDWAKYRFQNGSRTNPGGLLTTYSFEENGREVTESVGLVDDVGDGIIRCEIGTLSANCRVAVGPPDYAPDRRPIVSLADGLKDRVDRQSPLENDYMLDPDAPEEIKDLFERILETLGLMNLDFQNNRAMSENRGVARGLGLPAEEAAGRLFNEVGTIKGRKLPLTYLGNQKHRRFLSLEVMEDRFRENPDLLQRWVRKPMTGDKFYNTQMPPLMRGSDRYPFHISQRQYNQLSAWIMSLR